MMLFFVNHTPPPTSKPPYTRVPYTTRFRSGALQGRQAAPAAGDHAALQEREGQSGRGLPADAAPGADLLCAVQGADADDRNAPSAVRAVDQGSVGARSADPAQPVRAARFQDRKSTLLNSSH